MKNKNIINVEVSWCDKNYCCGCGIPEFGAVVATGHTIDEMKANFLDALQFQIRSMQEDGEDIPAWLLSGDYELQYELDAAALIRNAEEYTSLTAISKATGINAKLLSHYANNIKKPRPEQRRRIVEGLHAIGRSLIAVL